MTPGSATADTLGAAVAAAAEDRAAEAGAAGRAGLGGGATGVAAITRISGRAVAPEAGVVLGDCCADATPGASNAATTTAGNRPRKVGLFAVRPAPRAPGPTLTTRHIG